MATKMDSQPSKDDIESVFTRLRSIPANKTCFDCNAKNPTWSSVTYGVFICIDCSAVHRSLGVHLSFVRSTQLDTNWTWVQLRQMQLGGNSNALQFFNQHNCNTTDAQKKYNSRAAQLYREKISQSAISSLKTNPRLHVVPHHEEKPEQKEVDFFTEHENFTLPEISSQQQLSVQEETSTDYKGRVAKNINLEDGPKVDFCTTNTNSDVRKSTIAKKHTLKKTSLGVKKSALGATKVKTNFAEIEKEAELVEEFRLRAAEESLKMAALSAKEQEDREAAVRLAYKDLSQQQQKREEQMRKQDPKKAEQIERLGMGINSKCGISHSALSDMKTIEQESAQSTSLTLSSLGKLRLSDNDSFFDDFSCGNSFSMNRNTSNYSGSKIDSFLSETNSNSSKDSWVIIDDPPEKPKSSSYSYDKPREKSTKVIESVSGMDEAQKKFGNAKAISSDQFFNDQSADYETKANLSRFQGSSSISSAEFFGNGRDPIQTSSNMPSYDIEDVKESVRQGVTKVAGKLGSLANGWMSSIQDRYGY